jgi:protein involved in polysaccharide export with SLBB domain
MGRTISLFLVRAAGMLIAGMLLFAVFGHARAQTAENYGLKRFDGDNYDSVPPGAGIPAPPAPQGYAPVSGSGASPTGYYGTLNGGTSAPVGAYTPLNNGVTPVVTVSPPASQPNPNAPQGYQPAPAYAQSAMPTYQPPPAYQPPAASEPYGYKPLAPATPQYPQTAVAAASPYAYYQPQAGFAGRAGYDYALGPGDKLRLTVFGETDLSGEFTIDGSGFARLPLIGQVRAAGYTSQQLEAVIGSALSQGYLKSPRVSVEVTTYRPFYIIGAVNRPGQYPYIDHMNALNAIALAGGFTSGAVESVVFVRREGSNQEVEVPVDRTTQIYPGDVVKVHNTFFTDVASILSPFSGVAATAATAAIIQ